jgi:hypothetical protein
MRNMTIVLLAAFSLFAVHKASANSVLVSIGNTWHEAGYTIDSSRGEPLYGSPTSTLDYTGSGVTINADFSHDIGGDEKYRILAGARYTPEIGGGKMIDADYFSNLGAADAEATYGDQQRAGDRPGYVNRQDPPKLMSLTESEVESDSYAFSLYAQIDSAIYSSENSEVRMGIGFSIEHSFMMAKGNFYHQDPYEMFTQGFESTDTKTTSLESTYYSAELSLAGHHKLIHGFALSYKLNVSPVSVFYGEDIHYLRGDLKKDPSLTLSSVAHGYYGRVTLENNLSDTLVVGFGFNVSKYSGSKGVATFHYADGRDAGVVLSDNYLSRHSVSLELTFKYVLD